jgi:hypothetical protein
MDDLGITDLQLGTEWCLQKNTKHGHVQFFSSGGKYYWHIYPKKMMPVSKINLNTQTHILVRTATYYLQVFGESLCFRANKRF